MLRLPDGVTWIELGFQDAERPEDRRAAEHRAGRSAAAAGLAALGCAGTDIAPAAGGRGAPVFPIGFAGSIAHDRGHAAALVAAATSGWAAVGADLHVVRPMDETTASYISSPTERADARSAIGSGADHVLFALKEAVFKACCSLDRTWCEFEDIEVGIDPRGVAHLRRPRAVAAELRWAWTGDVIRAAAMIRHAA